MRSMMESVRDKEGYLRKSVVKDPIERENTKALRFRLCRKEQDPGT
mgnify:CR=1 FL=1